LIDVTDSVRLGVQDKDRVRVAVEQGAVFLLGFDVLLLQHRVFDGDADPISDQLQHVLLVIGEMSGFLTADSDDAEGLFFLGMDGNVGQRNEFVFFKKADFIGTAHGQILVHRKLVALGHLVDDAAVVEHAYLVAGLL
jgi:hypothetical protein